MASAVVAKATCLAVIMCMMALGAPFLGMAHFTCCEVKPVLEACGGYVKTGGDTVPQNCCMQVIALRNVVRNSTLSQQLACHCIQDAAKKVPDINTTAFASLPSRCGVNLHYQFSINMNCDNL
ncbi:Non-specific lipid-transfer protein 3 [Spatholobus suberectus]|nr:Non-specific lipid-transfer protein 3 [Spatholobus suberectus]